MKNSFTYLIIGLLLSSCSKTDKTYNVTGVVINIDEKKESILVDHDSIKGFMMPMVMPFKIRNKNM